MPFISAPPGPVAEALGVRGIVTIVMSRDFSANLGARSCLGSIGGCLGLKEGLLSPRVVSKLEVFLPLPPTC